jgi:hypothetical protein
LISFCHPCSLVAQAKVANSPRQAAGVSLSLLQFVLRLVEPLEQSLAFCGLQKCPA